MKNRLLAIDVLRGMTIALMILVNNPGSWGHVYAPFLHASWHGCTPTDLVFPFFIFTVGLSMAFSLGKNQDKTNGFLLSKALNRAILIVLVGFLLNWFPFYDRHISDVRIFGVLQRIGLAYGLAATLVILIRKERLLVFTSAGLLLAYWAIQYFGGSLSLEGNINLQADLAILPADRLYGGFGISFDPEGILGTISAAAHIMLGYLIGLRLYRTVKTADGFSTTGVVKIIPKLLLVGLIGLSLGLAWNYLDYPINKPIWTSSYVLYTAGWATLTLATLLYLLDVVQVRKWAFPFRVFGLNPLAAFVLSGVVAKLMFRIKIGDQTSWGYVYSHWLQPVFGDKSGSLVQALLMVGVIYLAALAMYRRRMIIKL
ncbi:MAG: heparan-alpha-glucosaminide N-acetyltransferase domain-containing protein [Bacteroidota bacterium]